MAGRLALGLSVAALSLSYLPLLLFAKQKPRLPNGLMSVIERSGRTAMKVRKIDGVVSGDANGT